MVGQENGFGMTMEFISEKWSDGQNGDVDGLMRLQVDGVLGLGDGVVSCSAGWVG